jgi:hypothetical protein
MVVFISAPISDFMGVDITPQFFLERRAAFWLIVWLLIELPLALICDKYLHDFLLYPHADAVISTFALSYHGFRYGPDSNRRHDVVIHAFADHAETQLDPKFKSPELRKRQVV